MGIEKKKRGFVVALDNTKKKLNLSKTKKNASIIRRKKGERGKAKSAVPEPQVIREKWGVEESTHTRVFFHGCLGEGL